MDFNSAIVVNGSLNEIQIKHLWQQLDQSLSAAPPQPAKSSISSSSDPPSLTALCREPAIIRLVLSVLLMYVLVTNAAPELRPNLFFFHLSNPICFFQNHNMGAAEHN